MISIQSKLTQDQINFLDHHGISLDLLFDIGGMKKKVYLELMKELKKEIGFNANPCIGLNHTLKDKYGHCVQCEPRYIAWINRREGFVYLACSPNRSLIKVGYTENIEGREESLTKTKYGGQSDWRIFYSSFSEKAAKIERETHKELKKFQAFGSYSHDGYFHYASELFTCTASLAKSTLEKKIKELGGDPSKALFKSIIADQFDKSLGGNKK